MNESAFGEPLPDHIPRSDEEGGMGHQNRPSDAAPAHTQATHTEPQFGVIDIVEAFTALRHEYRGQAKDSRQLIEQVQAAVQRIDDVAKQTAAYVELHHAGSQDIKQLVRVLVDTDLQLSRVVQAVTQSEKSRQTSEAHDRDAIEARFQRMSPLSRWFARPLYDLYVQQETKNSSKENSLLEGLSLTVSKLQQSMLDLGIERLEVLGKPFDGTTMNAIGTVESTTIAAGYVAEQISPCYRWKSAILRFADVRVAQPPSK